jgi:uncharacterized protein
MTFASGAAPAATAGGDVARRPALDRPAVSFALAILAVGSLLIGYEVSPRMAALFLIGAALGFVLLHGAFGFTAGWRSLVTIGDGRGFRAQLLTIGLTMLAFIPLINGYWPESIVGAVAPVGTSLVVGSFLFGLGMQLGNGCGSGTLFSLGGGSARMLVTLFAFIVGSVIGSIHLPWWLEQPGLDPVNLVEHLTIPGAILLQAAALGGLALLSLRRERRMGSVAPSQSSAGLWRGPWPFAWAAIGLAALGVVTLLVAGHPWTITYGFALWGAKAAQAVGIDMSGFAFWQWARGRMALESSLLADVTSVMNIGLILGAMLAAGLAGSFAKPLNLTPRFAVSAVIGGLLMGYGARLSFGCNIGALLGGIASGSLHGWLWFAFAFAGTLVGIRLRPFFGMAR